MAEAETRRRFREFRKRLVEEVKEEMFLQSLELSERIKKMHMTGGTTRTRLAVRTGALRGSTRPAPVRVIRGNVEAGVQIGTVYGRIHFGPRGTKTTIKPKAKKYLTIPLDEAKTPAGVLRAPARSSLWKDTFVRRSRRGNLLIFGRRGSGKIVPLFLLVKKVEIPARIDPDELIRWWHPRVIRGLREATLRARRRAA